MKKQLLNLSSKTSVILSICLALFIILLRLVGFFEQTELNLFDLYYKLAPAEARDERIVLVGITEEDIAKLKTNRLSDWQLYQILSTIAQGHPAAVGIDIFRDHPVPPNYWELRELQKQGIAALNSAEPFGHQEFLSIFKPHSNFFAVGKQAGIPGDTNFDLIAPPPIAREQIADVGVVLDSDGIQRRGLLYPITKDPAVPNLSWTLAQRYLEGKEAKIDGIERNNETHLKVNDTVFWKFRNFSGPYTRADEGGYQILINWRKSDFEVIAVSDILESKTDPSLFKDRIVIVGAYAPSLNDLFLTPLNSDWFGSPRRLNGIEAIAQVSSYILSAVLDDRPTLQTWREPWISFAIVTCGMITGYLITQVSVEWLNQALMVNVLAAIGLMCLFFGLLSIGYWLPVLPLVLSILCTAIVHYLVRTTLKRISDRQTILTYQEKLENMIEKRQHYLFIYNSFQALGNKIEQPIQSLLSIDESWSKYEVEFAQFLDNLNLSDSDRVKSKKILFQLMIEISKAKELRGIMMDLCTTFIPNLSHLKSAINLIEFSDALQSALDGVRDIYLSEYELKVDIKPLINVVDTRIEKNYVEGYYFKNLLVRILDQPIRYCHFQEMNLPNIDIIVSSDEQVVNLKICIFANYSPTQLNLFFCERIVQHNQGKIKIDRRSNCVVWNVSFRTDL